MPKGIYTRKARAKKVKVVRPKRPARAKRAVVPAILVPAPVQKAQNTRMATAAAPAPVPGDAEDDTGLDVNDLDLDIQGAMYELSEFGGLCGDAGEVDDDFSQLPIDVQGAIHTLGKWAGYDQEPEEEPDAASAPPPSTALATGQAAAAKVTQAAAVQKDEPISSDVYVPAMLGSGPATVRNHLASAHGVSKGKLANMSPSRMAGLHKAQHASGEMDHQHGKAQKTEEPGAFIAKAEVSGKSPTWLDKPAGEPLKVYTVVLHPSGPDYHGDEYPPVEIEKAAHKFMATLQKQRVAKAMQSDGHDSPEIDVDIIESYIAPQDFRMTDPSGKSHTVLKGSWVIGSQINDRELATAILKGERGGVSMEAMAVRYES